MQSCITVPFTLKKGLQMKVRYELKITQVTDGKNYKGHLKLGASTLMYQMEIPLGIPGANDALPESPDLEQLKSFFVITVSKEDESIALTDDEYTFFLRLLLMEVMDFYELPQTRDANERFLGAIDRSALAGLGFTTEFSVEKSGDFDLPQEFCDMLTGPKFECDLAA